MMAETPDDGKTWNGPVYLKHVDGADMALSEVMHPLSLTALVTPVCSAFHGVADDREMILRSADRGVQRSGGGDRG